MTHEEQARHLDELMESEGWAICRAAMQAEIATIVRLMCSPDTRLKPEFDFHRGAVWAAELLLDVPARVKQSVLNDARIMAAKQAAKPAKRK